MSDKYDLAIIGAGPVGLFAATLGRLHGMSTVLIDSLTSPGGQLTALYPEKPIYDVPGFHGVSGKNLADQLAEQAMKFHPDIRVGETVTWLARSESEPPLWEIQTGSHARILSRSVLLTVGVGAFVPRRLPIEIPNRWVGEGLYYVVPDLRTFDGITVAIVGGGDTAVDWALTLAEHARRVLLIHRREHFRAQEYSLEQIRQTDKINVVVPYELAAIHTNQDKIIGVVVKHANTQDSLSIAVDAIVSGLGFLPSLGPVKTWGMAMAGNLIVVDPSSMETSLPGVYAAGDVVAYPGKVKLIATGFGEVGIAIARIRTYLDPSKKSLPHSTNLKVAQG